MRKKLFYIFVALILFIFPLSAKAETIYATSEDGTKTYTSIDSAWSAAQNGVSIVMQCDWNISSRLVLIEGRSATVEMNGHKISRNLSSAKTNGEVIKVEKRATLNLNGSKASNTVFNVNGYSQDGTTKVTITSGGLITGGASTNGGGGIHMKEGSTLNLNCVAISGNYAEDSWGTDGYGGGVYMDGDGDTLKMTNLAQISYNKSTEGGAGIYVDDKSATIDMIDSQISYNYTDGNGSGFYSSGTFTTIKLDNSCIDHNVVNNESTIWFDTTDFELISNNNTGYVRYNTYLNGGDGGAIMINQSVLTKNKGLIQGISFIENVGKTGGAIDVEQENITVSNCLFKGNSAYVGSAIYVNNDGFTLENTTIEENTTLSGKSGALEVDSMNDITLKGKIIIQNNYDSFNKVDADLYLQTGVASDAYIISAPDTSSSIGLVITGKRVMAKNQTSDSRIIYKLNGNERGENGLSYDDSAKTLSIVKGNNVIIAEASNQDTALLENAPSITSDPTQDIEEIETTEEVQITATVESELPEETASPEPSEDSVEEIHTVTLNLVSEDETVLDTQILEFSATDSFELQAPTIEDKTFVEWQNIPENITVDSETLKADSLAEDVELTAVYRDVQSEEVSEEVSETGSIFGNGSSTVALTVIILLAVFGGLTYYKKRNKQA